MYRFIRTAALQALQETADQATKAELALREDSDKSRQALVEESKRADVAEATVGALRIELEAARAQVLLDAEDRVALRMLLRTARKQTARAERVYALFRHGALHSVHATQDAAEIAAEGEGASRDQWMRHEPGAGLPPAVEVDWRIQPLPLGGRR